MSYEPQLGKTGILTRSDINRGAQPQKMARGLKHWIKERWGLHYMCCENKGADQLCGYHAADQRLCFRNTYSEKLVF